VICCIFKLHTHILFLNGAHNLVASSNPWEVCTFKLYRYLAWPFKWLQRPTHPECWKPKNKFKFGTFMSINKQYQPTDNRRIRKSDKSRNVRRCSQRQSIGYRAAKPRWLWNIFRFLLNQSDHSWQEVLQVAKILFSKAAQPLVIRWFAVSTPQILHSSILIPRKEITSPIPSTSTRDVMLPSPAYFPYSPPVLQPICSLYSFLFWVGFYYEKCRRNALSHRRIWVLVHADSIHISCINHIS
jgi:hypothetical protein